MPELPEVQTIVSMIGPLVRNRRILGVSHLRTDMVKPADMDWGLALTGSRILSVTRRAKRIIFRLDPYSGFYIHLGMTGQLRVVSVSERLMPHTHLILNLDAPFQLRFIDPRRFGKIIWMDTIDDTKLGPEPLTLTTEQLIQILRNTSRAIKPLLLDQNRIAGIGNIYADEILHRARIHPQTPACALTQLQVRTLNQAMKRVLHQAIRQGGSTIRDYVDAEGKTGGFQRLHRVYQRFGLPCFRCGTPVQKIILISRSTYFCPTCQPE